jgi:GT2 family glycosyltransferase
MGNASMPIVSIIVVTCGFGGYLRSCLDSIIEQTYKNFEIIVIDNSLKQGFAQELNRLYPMIKLYSSPVNLFYCQGLNQGIGFSKGEFALCLNDDVVLDVRFLEEALRGFAIAEDIGMVSGKILRRDRKIIDSSGLCLSIWRTAKERGYAEKDTGQYQKGGYIFGVNGAVAFYRHRMLENIKLGADYFDSDFRAFYEDLDIAWRAQGLGWKAYYIPTAIAYHTRGGSVREGRGLDKRYARRYLSNELHFDLIKNRYLTIIKNETFLSFLLHLFFILIYDIFVLGYIIFFKFSLIKLFFFYPIPINSAFKKRLMIKEKIRSLKQTVASMS